MNALFIIALTLLMVISLLVSSFMLLIRTLDDLVFRPKCHIVTIILSEESLLVRLSLAQN